MLYGLKPVFLIPWPEGQGYSEGQGHSKGQGYSCIAPVFRPEIQNDNEL